MHRRWYSVLLWGASCVRVALLASLASLETESATTENARAWGLGWLAAENINQHNVPVVVNGLTGVVAVAAGPFHSLALTSDGKVWAWGDNTYGQLGNASYNNSGVPVMVSSLTSVVAIDTAGGCCAGHSLAVKADGTVWAWGSNDAGELGNGKQFIGSNVPVKASKLTNVVAVAAGAYFSLALKGDGRVWAWGANEEGRLGNGSFDGSDVPVAVSNLTGVVGIAIGVVHGLAVKSDGTVWVWGDNEGGQLGIGTDVPFINVPITVSNLPPVRAVAGGRNHSMALASDGRVWTWGWNGDGQLGNGTNSDSIAPVRVSDLNDVITLASGNYHNVALKRNGTVWGWGWGERGQLGHGKSASTNVPVEVSNLTGAVAIGGGLNLSLAALEDGIPSVALAPVKVGFGSVEPDATSSPKAVTVTNTGEGLLDVKALELTGINPGDFAKTADNCSGAILMPGGSCRIVATFTPSDSGSRSAAFLISSNGPRSPHVVTLEGTGSPEIRVDVVTPNGGERLHTGTPYRIEWAASSTVALSNLDVQYSTNGGASFSPVPGCTGLPGTRRNCVWVTPGPATSSGRIRVIATDGGDTGSDTSDSNYNVVSGTAAIQVTAPKGAVKWATGSQQRIKWDHNLGQNSLVKIEISRNGGGIWTPISGAIPNTGAFIWKVRGPATDQASIRVSWTGNPTVRDANNADFSIAAPFVRITNPNGGEQWKKETTHPVMWTSNLGNQESVKIELSTDGGVTWLSLAAAKAAMDPLLTLIDSTPSDGSQQVPLPNLTSNRCRIRVAWLDNLSVSDISNANFAIVP